MVLIMKSVFNFIHLFSFFFFLEETHQTCYLLYHSHTQAVANTYLFQLRPLARPPPHLPIP